MWTGLRLCSVGRWILLGFKSKIVLCFYGILCVVSICLFRYQTVRPTCYCIPIIYSVKYCKMLPQNLPIIEIYNLPKIRRLQYTVLQIFICCPMFWNFYVILKYFYVLIPNITTVFFLYHARTFWQNHFEQRNVIYRLMLSAFSFRTMISS